MYRLEPVSLYPSLQVLSKDAPEVQEAPEVGVYVTGLFLQGAGWHRERSQLVESAKGELFVRMLVIWYDHGAPGV